LKKKNCLGFAVISEPPQKLEQKSSLPHSGLGDDGHESPPGFNAIQKR
jgi:hypothetical protein